MILDTFNIQFSPDKIRNMINRQWSERAKYLAVIRRFSTTKIFLHKKIGHTCNIISAFSNLLSLIFAL